MERNTVHPEPRLRDWMRVSVCISHLRFRHATGRGHGRATSNSTLPPGFDWTTVRDEPIPSVQKLFFRDVMKKSDGLMMKVGSFLTAGAARPRGRGGDTARAGPKGTASDIRGISEGYRNGPAHRRSGPRLRASAKHVTSAAVPRENALYLVGESSSCVEDEGHNRSERGRRRKVRPRRRSSAETEEEGILHTRPAKVKMQGLRWKLRVRPREEKEAMQECGGAGICQHGRQRSQCKECGGVSICPHGRRRTMCKECGGAHICRHGKEKSEVQNGGISLCSHGRSQVAVQGVRRVWILRARSSSDPVRRLRRRGLVQAQ